MVFMGGDFSRVFTLQFFFFGSFDDKKKERKIYKKRIAVAFYKFVQRHNVYTNIEFDRQLDRLGFIDLPIDSSNTFTFLTNCCTFKVVTQLVSAKKICTVDSRYNAKKNNNKIREKV